ncbi:hypothetical protein IB265_32865 [Ensifer sp. ENS10]|uniref:hypothetical protein n=1 Tax=Ensifer sp. ENS10 TaxID=2769286 RepID=UPI0017828595|nr:hypothetical protein [Ensifer sp. ENS10]MBD9511549.1 hypothetical protein [Ensifer sp. ENS10]
MKPQSARQQKLACDACHYMEDVDRLHKGLIGKECPDCQSVMLTAEDYRIAKRAMRKLAILAWLSRMIVRMYPAAGVGTMQVQVKDGQMFSEFHKDKHL